MKSEYKKRAGLAFIALPFVAMLLMIGINARNISHTEYRVAIEGYDPRDLLKGHYLVFRYKWPDNAPDMFADHTYPRAKHVCACFSGDPQQPEVRFDACESTHPRQKMCEGALSVSGGAGFAGYQPDHALRRFFIPEEHAQKLEQLLREGRHRFEVGLVPRGRGVAQLKALYIDGQTMEDFLQTQP